MAGNNFQFARAKHHSQNYLCIYFLTMRAKCPSHLTRYFTSPLIYIYIYISVFTSACLMSLQWKWIRNIWTTHNAGSQAQLEMPTGWIIMHSDPVKFAHHSLTSCCKENWTYKQGIFTCAWSLFQRTKENAYTVSTQCRYSVNISPNTIWTIGTFQKFFP
jgi:hypothetical protein